MRNPRPRRHGLAWAFLTVFQFTIIDAYVLYEQREGYPAHYVPDPKSPRFPAHATIFAGDAHGRWSCHYMAAFNAMMAERKKEHTKYWCRLQSVQGERLNNR